MSINSIVYPNGGVEVLNVNGLHIGNLSITNSGASGAISTTQLLNAGSASVIPTGMTASEIVVATSTSAIGTANGATGPITVHNSFNVYDATGPSLLLAADAAGRKITLSSAGAAIAGTTAGTGGVNVTTTDVGTNVVVSTAYTGTSNGGVVISAAGIASNVANKAVNFITAGGSAFVSSAGTFVPVSDGTLKRDIEDCVLGADFIDCLKPKSYHMLNDEEGAQILHGFIAQEVEEACIQKQFNWGGVIKPIDSHYGLSYNDLIAPIVKNLQELNAKSKECKCSCQKQ